MNTSNQSYWTETAGVEKHFTPRRSNFMKRELYSWIAALFVVMLICHAPANGANRAGLYSNSTLSYWQGRYSENILWNFNNSIWRELSAQEKNRLRNLEIVFPLTAPNGDPFAFYTLLGANSAQVNLPIFSIKFFDDLAISQSWLNENGYDSQLPLDYVALLKYLHPADFPGGKYQAPLRALKIPSNALQNQSVDEISQKILKSTITWILLHEIGHAYFRHGEPASAEIAQQQEVDADNFATEIMRRIGVAPIGMGVFFAAAVHWWPNRSDCPSNAAWMQAIRKSSHPITTDRLQNLSSGIWTYRQDFVRKEPNPQRALAAISVATQTLSQMAHFLANEELQNTIRKKAELFGALPDPLGPRFPGQLPVAPSTPMVRIPNTITTICPP
jgi:hypothetical protein